MTTLTVGVDYPCRYAAADVKQPSIHACIKPSSQDIASLAALLSSTRIKMVVSIGCGDGYIEGLLQQKCDIQMLGMDLYQTEDDFESYLNTTVYLPSILRVKRGELLNLNHYRTECSVAEENVALLFCFGRRLPWQAYLDAFPWVSMNCPLPST
jgi:hypothetical protein